MQQVLARKNVQKTKFKATEMILDPWNQQDILLNKVLRSNACFLRVHGAFVMSVVLLHSETLRG